MEAEARLAEKRAGLPRVSSPSATALVPTTATEDTAPSTAAESAREILPRLGRPEWREDPSLVSRAERRGRTLLALWLVLSGGLLATTLFVPEFHHAFADPISVVLIGGAITLITLGVNVATGRSAKSRDIALEREKAEREAERERQKTRRASHLARAKMRLLATIGERSPTLSEVLDPIDKLPSYDAEIYSEALDALRLEGAVVENRNGRLERPDNTPTKME